MTADEIYMYLCQQCSPEEIKATIRAPVSHWRATKLHKKGGALPVEITASGHTRIITQEHIKQIIQDFSANRLTALEVEYLMSCLELCGDFVCENTLQQAVFDLSSPEVNGELTPARIQEIRTSYLS